MIKRITVMSLIVLVIGAATVYWLKETTNAKLAEAVIVNEQKDNFFLHIRVENSGEGFRVLHSLEYRGEDSITIEHRTPLTAVAISINNSDFTGSSLIKTLDPGDIYRPQEPIIYDTLDKGTYTLYVHTQFFIDGEPVDIKVEKEIVFE